MRFRPALRGLKQRSFICCISHSHWFPTRLEGIETSSAEPHSGVIKFGFRPALRGLKPIHSNDNVAPNTSFRPALRGLKLLLFTPLS